MRKDIQSIFALIQKLAHGRKVTSYVLRRDVPEDYLGIKNRINELNALITASAKEQPKQPSKSGLAGNYTPKVATPKVSRRNLRLPIALTLVAGIGLSLAAVSISGCRKAAPSKPAASSSVTPEHQAAEEKIKAQIQALLQYLSNDEDQKLNLTGPLTHMLVSEAEFNKFQDLAKEDRIRFAKVAEKDMPLLYNLAQELNAVIGGYSYFNAFTLTTQDENGLPAYTVIINEKEFQKPPVELWITLIHEVLGHMGNAEMIGRLGNLAAEEARAYTTEAQVLDVLIRYNNNMIQAAQQANLSEEDLKLLLQALDIDTLIEKQNKAKQQAEFYQRKADTKPTIPRIGHSSCIPRRLWSHLSRAEPRDPA